MKRLLAVFTVFALILSAAAAYADEFRPLPIDMSGGAPLGAKFDYNVTVYEDPTIRVEHFRVESPGSEWGVIYYYALISIKDPSQLRTACTDGVSFVSGARSRADVMAKRVNAVLAINGDFCGNFMGTKCNTYILRQGTVFRDMTEPTLDTLLIDEDGDFHVLQRGDDMVSADKTVIDGKKVINAFQFGPALVIDGQKVDDETVLDYSRSPSNALPDRRAQRMCIAQIDKLQYMVLCCRQGIPLTSLRDLAMTIADCKTVYTLDGGNSAQFVYMGTKINNVKKESGPVRPVLDIIYFASAWFTD